MITSFWRWLNKQRKREDPIGDLARDAYGDPRVARLRSPEGWRKYFAEVGACEGAVDAMENAWLEYRARRTP